MDKLQKLKQKFFYPEDRNQIPDIYTFQETRSSPEVVRFWNTVLPGKIAYSHGTSHSKGILLGIHPRSSVQLKSTVEDKEGRYLLAECQLDQELFTVASVYLEPTMDPDLFISVIDEISSRINLFGHNRVLWLGDFNTAIDLNLDTTSTHWHHRPEAQVRHSALQSLLETHDLTDVWRAMNSPQTRFTVCSPLSGGVMF